MNAQLWLNASRRYEKQKAQQALKAAADANAAHRKTAGKYDQQRLREEDIAVAITELNRFLESDDWSAARQLLASSNSHVVIVEEYEGGGRGIVYFLDEKGLQKSIEPMGMSLAYTQKKDIPQPEISPTSAQKVARLAIRQGAKPPQIMERIRKELDRIALKVMQK